MINALHPLERPVIQLFQPDLFRWGGNIVKEAFGLVQVPQNDHCRPIKTICTYWCFAMLEIMEQGGKSGDVVRCLACHIVDVFQFSAIAQRFFNGVILADPEGFYFRRECHEAGFKPAFFCYWQFIRQ